MMYEALKKEIESAPATWLPGLLRVTVEAALRAKVFVPGGLERFVARTVEHFKA